MTGEELWTRLEEYAASYLPQWRYDRDGPEPESALLTALGLLLEEGRGELERLPERWEEAFLSAFGLEERKPGAARAYACFAAPEETLVPAGSEFYLGGDGTRVWTTERDVWASPIRLVGQLLTGGGSGKLIPMDLPSRKAPSRLFDFRAAGSQRRAVRFSHPDAFASRGGCEVKLTLERASEELLEFLAGDGTAWSLEGERDSTALAPPRLEGRALRFALPAASGVRAIVAEASGVPPEGPGGTARADAARPGFSDGEGLPLDAAFTDGGPADGGEFLPFGADVAPWQMCHLACGDALGLRGARVTVSWAMAMENRETLLPGQDREPVYKPVMRYLPPEPPEVRDVWADGVAWEYWNGGGWRTVPGTQRYAGCFGPPDRGAVGMSASFPWPQDAQSCQEQGVDAYWLRWRVRTAEGSGWMPRRSHAPSVSDVRFSALLSDGTVSMERSCGLSGTPFAAIGPEDALFPRLTEDWDEWWLCFDRPPQGGALELYLTFSGTVGGGTLSAWERTAQGGARQLTMRDGTAGMAHSGCVSLAGIQGQISERFGRKGWWMCFRDERGTFRSGGRFPLLTGLSCGAVRVRSRGDGTCAPGDALRPMRGGTASGSALTGSFGGGGGGTRGERRERERRMRHYLGRGMSRQDIEQLLQGALEDVARACAARSGDALEVAVLMRDVSHHAAAFSLQEEEIRRVLMERSVLPTLGLELRLREPRFYPIHVTLWAAPGPGESFDLVRHALLDALERFLHPVAGGFQGKGWRLGGIPSLLQLRSCLQAAAPGAALAQLSALAVTPEGRELDVGGVCDPFALPVNGRHSIFELEGGGPL